MDIHKKPTKMQAIRATRIRKLHAAALEQKALLHIDNPANVRQNAYVAFNEILAHWSRASEAYRFDYGQYPDTH